MRKLTRSYLAGLIDGEGYFGIRRKKNPDGEWRYYEPVIKVAMCNEPIIQWLKDSFGGHKFLREGTGNQSDSWSWELYGTERVQKFTKEIVDFLRVKNEQAHTILKLCSTFNEDSYETSGSGKSVKEDVIEYRQKLYEYVKSCNG